MPKEGLPLDVPFGKGIFVGLVEASTSFFDLPIRDQARVLGWANSCPVVTELTDPTNLAPGRGPEAMVARYAEVNVWFGFIQRAVGEIKPALREKLMLSVPRRPDEPIGKYEPESIPAINKYLMAPLGTLAGFSLPRLMIEQLHTGEDTSYKAAQERLVEGLSALDLAIQEAETPLELLAVFAEKLTENGAVHFEKILQNILSVGWLEEHNAHSMLEDFKKALVDKAPVLWDLYESLRPEDKEKLKLV